MWRFILVSFAFLGWSFYVLSGGADYRPVANSIQARAILDNQRPKPRPLRVNVIELAQDGMVAPETSVTRTITSLHDLDLTVGKRVAVTLASTEATPAAVTTAVIDVPTVKATAVMVPKTPGLDAVPEPAEVVQAALSQSRDIRTVASTKVNMRSGPGTNYSRIGQLSRGTEVIVLRDPGNGWIKLRVQESGRIGWMADRLLTAAN
ncbi:SH3 domain-containing protein [Roseovarius lutimaris]|uniref:SH3 domain-containing protein n=1 Tax=Roseovarius lutimaris TaxID=1005928 RepID=A0A1I5FLJ0_9RHOB|nr:SH3 domain-containing protein [Roseovarius lutimaris]SFO24479.1 SH3 domain-containing protein [Roseovarius lutimaris]